MTTELPNTNPCLPADTPLALKSNEGLGVWLPTDDPARLPGFDVPVLLYEKGRGIWVGARDDSSDGWLWGNTYGSHYYAETTGGHGAWRCHDNDPDDDYQPTHWMPLPGPPQRA